MTAGVRTIELSGGGPTDLPLVSQLMSEAFDAAYGEAWTSGQCLGMLSMPGTWLTLAWEGERPQGFALARVIAGDGELLLLGVRPATRRRGIGAALLRSVIAEAMERKAERLHLEVRAGNAALELYRAHQFEQVGQRRDYYRGSNGQSYDALTLARRLQNGSS